MRLDLHSSSSAVRLIRQAQGFRRDDLTSATFLSRAVPNTRLIDEVMSVLGKVEGVALLKTVIHQRQAICLTAVLRNHRCFRTAIGSLVDGR
ncbi:MAG: hypothetical protein ACRC11_11455 [Xenococcaceae cyanobacterium]